MPPGRPAASSTVRRGPGASFTGGMDLAATAASNLYLAGANSDSHNAFTQKGIATLSTATKRIPCKLVACCWAGPRRCLHSTAC